MAKDLLYHQEAQAKILAGVEKLAKTVAITMGPKGYNVIISKAIGAPVITKDGVSVAREIVLADHVEEQGCQLIKEVAGRTADVAGDGTTTATVLAHEILLQGQALIKDGYSPLDFRDGIEWGVKQILQKIDELTIPIKDRSDIYNVATISTNNDPEIGEKIAEAFDRVGWGGQVTAEAMPGQKEMTIRFTDGLELNSGYLHAGFLVGEDNPNECVFENSYILICDREITHAHDNQGLFTKVAEQNKPILIICRGVKQQGLAFLLLNKKAGQLRSVAVKIPNFGAQSDDWLRDLSLMTGATIASDESPLSEFTLEDLGFAKKIVVGRTMTRVLNPNRDEELIAKRIKQYETISMAHMGDLERQDVRNRITFLTAKAAVISVGYTTELELREKGDRIEDAIFAVKAAIESGYIPGGGTTLLRAARGVDINQAKPEHQRAVQALVRACERPFRQIILNAEQDPDPILNQVLANQDPSYGFNSANNTFGNLLEMGIIDPAKVAKTALENAASIASLLIRTGAIIAEIPDNPSSWQPVAGYRLPDQRTNMNHKY